MPGASSVESRRVDVPETQRLLRAALDGGVAELAALLERMRARIVLWCAARMSADMRSKLEPEDLTQEILLAVHRDFDKYRGPADRPFFKWLFTVADHKLKDVADYYAAQKRQTPEPLQRSQASPSQAAAMKENIVRLREAIEALPEDYRTVVRLYKLEGRDVAEIAGLLGRTENAVRLLYFRALAALRDTLGGSQAPMSRA